MCGINGIYAYHDAANPIDRVELTRTRDHMAARGPDGIGAWIGRDGRIGFGHRRLSIIDLSDAGAQPMVSANGKLVVAFNGEIYNYRELRSSLEAKGHVFRSQSDTEILLHLYAEQGEALVHDLRGMYAFAIWDEQRRGLLLARDPYGIKPLYTANDGWTFRFASQVKALLAGGQVSRDPEPAGHAGFYLFGHVPEPFTLYRDIRALPAGHWQWIDRSGPREPKRFANLAAVLAEGASHPAPPSELGARLREAALESVRTHLVADVEVGVFLSAGIDSGALLGLMRDAGQNKIRAITLGFDQFAGTAEDEAPLASVAAKQYGAEHIVRRVSEREFWDDLPRILEAMDQPSIDGVNTWFVAKATREAGLKVALSGAGGDELLAGYPSFRDIPNWRRRYGTLASVPFLGWSVRTLTQAILPQMAEGRPKALGMLEYANSWAGAYLLRRALFLPYELPALLGNDVAREGLRRLDPIRTIKAQLLPDPGSETGRICVLESSNYLRNQLLRDADWAGMAHGLEIRVPLVDWNLARSLGPLIAPLKGGAGKVALAGAPSIRLPDEICHRAKTGFAVPTGVWISAATGLAHGDHKGATSRSWSKWVLSGIAAPLAVQIQ